jgi:hypothetical protein
MTIEVKGLKENLRLLQRINPALSKEIRKDFRALAKPAVDEIEKAKPTKQGLPRGFQHAGRTGANAVRKVRINFNTRRARARNLAQGVKYETLGTIRIQTADAATAIADMAGKVGNVQTSGRSRAYPRRPQGHKLNGQGAVMIRKLNSIGSPSRFMWPGAERGLNGQEQEFVKLARRVEDEINKELMKIGSSANEIRALQRRNR